MKSLSKWWSEAISLIWQREDERQSGHYAQAMVAVSHQQLRRL